MGILYYIALYYTILYYLLLHYTYTILFYTRLGITDEQTLNKEGKGFLYGLQELPFTVTWLFEINRKIQEV